MHKLLLLSDHPPHTGELCRIFQAQQFEVVDGIGQINSVLPVYTLAVLKMNPKRMQCVLADLRERNVASKLLALVPLEAEGMETSLTGCGADDVLAFPVTRARLELTVRNLLRVHLLERAGDAAFRMEARAAAQTRPRGL